MRQGICYGLVLGLLAVGQGLIQAEDSKKPSYAGPIEGGYLLANGWRLTPVGDQVPVPDLTLNIHPLNDGRHVLISSNGFNLHQLSLVDIETKTVVDKVASIQSWFGLAVSPDESKVWWSGGGGANVLACSLKGTDLSLDSKGIMNFRKAGVRSDALFRSGLTLDADRKRFYSLDIEQGTLDVIDMDGQAEPREIAVGGRPYDVVVGPTMLYVSDWAKGVVHVIEPDSLRVVGKISVGAHPNQMVRHPKDDRLFVACASDNCVSVIDMGRGVVIETIYTTLFPKSPEGSTPDAVAVSPNGEYLFVANADNNSVAMIEIEEMAESKVMGFIPTGWYPTSLAVSKDGKNLLVGVGWGMGSSPNPFGGVAGPKDIEDANKPGKEGEQVPKKRRLPYPYIGTLFSGSLSIVPIPDEKQLDAYTAQVFENCPYSDDMLVGTKFTGASAVPAKVGDESPISHIIYIIKENRTYDQVFGDMPVGNGDPSLVMFGEEVTPNQHKLASEFVLLDNLYCNGHVSRDGHPWSTSAFATDWTARDWMLTYSGRGGISDDDEGNLSRPPSGYLWDACQRAGLSYRSYGEYGNRVSQPDGTVAMEARVPGLVGHICPDFGISKVPGVRMRDPDNVDAFIKEFDQYLAEDNLPRFIIMSLGEDHTTGTAPGTYTPEACVASNDLAVGRLVEHVSKSKIWPKVAIFVIEDDAQNGPDHVDSHRTIGLVVSPYAKRKSLDSTQYSTVSMLRTIELILGLDPLSQYDAGATAMYQSFTDKPDLTPFEHVEPKIDINEKNTLLSYGAERSQRMDFSEYDQINDFEMNEILWRAVKGKDAPIPPAVRRAIAYRTGILGSDAPE